MSNLKILVVDDDTAFRIGVQKFLAQQGFTHVRTAGSGEIAVDIVKKEAPDMILLDLYLPDMIGLKALREIHKIDKRIPIFIVSCETDEEQRDLAMRLGATAYLTKPITLQTLYAHVVTRLRPAA